MNNKKLSVFAFLSFCLQASLSEAHTFNSTRPGTGTGVTFVSGKIDLVEAGFEFRKSNPEESHDFETNAFPDLLLRFGLSEKMDLSIDVTYVVIDLPKTADYKKRSCFTDHTTAGKFKTGEYTLSEILTSTLAEDHLLIDSSKVSCNDPSVCLHLLNSRDFSVGYNPYGEYFPLENFSISAHAGSSNLLNSDLQVGTITKTEISDDPYLCGFTLNRLIGKN